MRKLAFALLLAIALMSFGAAQAQGEITVDSQTYDNHFPSDITFHLKAHGNASINKVTIYYTVGSTNSYSYAYPAFTPGQAVQADYALPTNGNNYKAPGSIIKYYYQIEDTTGNQLKTEPVTLTYEDTRFTWQKIPGEQLTVYWYAQERVGQQVFQVGQDTLAKMKTAAGESLERPVKIYVYASKKDMDAALPFRSQTTVQEIITEGEAFSDADEVLILGSGSEVSATTAHELTHLITDQLTHNAFTSIPAWLNEGLSMYAEGELRAVNQQAINSAVRGNALLNLRAISSPPGRPQDVNLFYGEAYSVVRHMIDTYGSNKMSQLLATFKQGATTEEALMKVYGLNIDSLEAGWRAALGAAPAPTPAAQSGQAQAPSVPTIAPFGAKPQGTGPGAQPPQGQTQNQGNITLYVALAAGAVILLAAVAALAFVRRR